MTLGPPPQTAILIVNGFDRSGRWGEFNESEALRYPWISLCLDQIERHSRGSRYEVLVWDNSGLKEQQQALRERSHVRLFVSPRDEGLAHGASLDQLVTHVRPGTEFVITLDTDSFPIRDGWIEDLTGRLDSEVLLAGVWREELLPEKPAYIHPCGLAARVATMATLDRSFRALGRGRDVGYQITEAALTAGGQVSKLRRSNHWNPHFLMGAIYGDLIYHQGAGSRKPGFRAQGPAKRHEELRQALRDAAFEDLDALIAVLRGARAPDATPRLQAIAERNTATTGSPD